MKLFLRNNIYKALKHISSNERILQRVASDFTKSNEQRVKSYAFP